MLNAICCSPTNVNMTSNDITYRTDKTFHTHMSQMKHVTEHLVHDTWVSIRLLTNKQGNPVAFRAHVYTIKLLKCAFTKCRLK